MYDSLVPAAFWLIFSALGLTSLAFLLGTFLSSLQLTTARSHVDDGSEDPESASYKIYELSLASGVLSVVAGLVFIPLLATVILAFVASTVLASSVALGLAIVLLVASDVIRERHARLETAFHAHTGMTIREVYVHIVDGKVPLPVPIRTDLSAPSN